MDGKNEEIMDAVRDWVFSDAVAERMQAFASKHCDGFEYIADRDAFDDAENKVAYTELYKTYQTEFEAEIEKFVTSKGWTFDEFLAACAAGGSTGLPSLLVATTEYPVFKIIMLEEKKKKVEGTA